MYFCQGYSDEIHRLNPAIGSGCSGFTKKRKERKLGRVWALGMGLAGFKIYMFLRTHIES